MKDFLMIWIVCFLAVAIVISALVPNANIWIVIVVIALILAMLCYWIMKLFERVETLEKEELAMNNAGQAHKKAPQPPENENKTE